MNEILQFATQATPLMIIALLVIVVFQLVGGKNVINKIRGTQKEKYPELKDEHLKIMEAFVAQNEKFATNHMMHEIPDIKKEVSEIKQDLKSVIAVQTDQGLKIATLLERSKK